MTRRRIIPSLALAGIALQPAAAAAAPAPDRFVLGVNGVGEACTAARVWTGAGGPVRLAADQPFAIACRGLSAAQAQGYVSAPSAVPAPEQCGDPLRADVAGLGPVEVRRCFDKQLARPVIDMRLTRGGRTYQGAALETAAGVLENALRVVAAGADAPGARAVAKPSVDLAAVPQGPLVTAAVQGAGLTAEAAMTDGVASLQAGRMLDASRILNDALRQFAGAAPATQVDLRLAAGLADSNLSQFPDADQHFAAADALLAGGQVPNAALKQRNLQVYRGLHLINQRRWPDAVAVLARGDGSGADLADPVVLSRLNQETQSTDTLQSTLADTAALERNLLEAQRNWALSVAYLAQGEIPAAEQALARAVEAARDPVRTYPQERIVWMRASIERQKGRIEARKNAIEPALASFDCAIAALQGSAPRAPAACLLTPGQRLPDAATNAPVLVEAQLEGASIAARDPALDRAETLKAYASAVQSMSSLVGTGTVSLAALERYFTLLTQAPASASRDEEYFRAMQTIGEPAIAREYAQLQKVVSADGEVAGLLRQRSDLERQLIRLRYEISASAGATPAVDVAALEAERAAADAKLTDVNAKLLQADGIGALEDQPATVASIRDALAPGEAYLKVAALNTAMFGIVIAKDRTDIYQLNGSLADIEGLAGRVLTSAHSTDTGVINPFAVAEAARLYRAVAGPAAERLAGASRINYNPAGALRQVPLAILVADQASADAYARQSVKGDYSKVGFLGRRAESAVALSPRAFLRSRKDVAPSGAPRPFIGLGENAPPEPAPAALGEERMPFDCALTYNAWAGAVAGRAPVSAREISVAAQALGIAGAPEVTGARFTDASLVAGQVGQGLDQYQIIHFATHGIPETTVRVDQCTMHLPPSLVTTLVAPDADGRIRSDGLLSFDEVARLRLNANLVVLSACDTSAGASGTLARRRGVEDVTPALDGLVRSFIVANARAVLATFWRVPAIQQSDDLMAAFYGAGRSEPMAEALRTAQTSLITQPRFSHPYYWGAYFLVGDGEKTMLSPVRTAAR